MKKNFKKYLALMLAVVMAFTTLSLVACNPNSLGKDTGTEAFKNPPSLSLETKNSPFLSLSATTAIRATTNGNILEHTLTATVLPETAENKAVDWSIQWEDTSIEEDLDEYVRLNIHGDGSNVVTVTCLRPFTGNVIIEVTTREGGFKAQCICKYVGIPSNMEVDLYDATIVTDTDWNVDVVEISGDNTTSYHTISLSNIFGTPGADFTPEYDIVLEAHGGIYTQNTTYDASGNLTGTEQGEIIMQTMDFFDTAGYCSAYFVGEKGAFNMLYAGIRNDKLYLTGSNYPVAYHWEKTNTDGTISKAVFDGYIDDMEPYVTVTLTEKVTGLTYTFNVRTVGTVNNVNLDYSEIIF